MDKITAPRPALAGGRTRAGVVKLGRTSDPPYSTPVSASKTGAVPA